MGKMYKIVRYVPRDVEFLGGSVSGAKKYHGFEKAKQGMLNTIKKKFAGMDKYCADLIDSYCEKYYPNGAPKNFDMLKNLLTDFILRPEELEWELDDKYSDIDFEDERVRFALSFDFTPEGIIRILYIDVVEDAKCEFPEGVINAFHLKELEDVESERVVILSAGKDYGLDVVFSLLTDDDENEYPWEDWDWLSQNIKYKSPCFTDTNSTNL